MTSDLYIRHVELNVTVCLLLMLLCTNQQELKTHLCRKNSDGGTMGPLKDDQKIELKRDSDGQNLLTINLAKALFDAIQPHIAKLELLIAGSWIEGNAIISLDIGLGHFGFEGLFLLFAIWAWAQHRYP